MVEIARALRVDELTHASPMVILDEPTSVLERNETAILEREIAALKNIGSVIFVSHRLDEVRRICDRIVVMRSGEIVADRPTGEVTEDDLFKLMIGHAAKAKKRSDAGRHQRSGPLLRCTGLTRKGEYKDVDFTIRPGHCVAIVGTLGSGRESLVRALFGAEPFDSGEIRYQGKQLSSWSAAQATRSGMAYVPAERKTEGMVGGFSSAENIALARTGRRPGSCQPAGPEEAGPRVVRAARRPARRHQAAPPAGSPAATSRRSSWPSGCSRRPCTAHPGPSVAWPGPGRGRDGERPDPGRP